MSEQVGDECLNEECGHPHLSRVGASYTRTKVCYVAERGEDGKLHFCCDCFDYKVPPMIAALSPAPSDATEQG